MQSNYHGSRDTIEPEKELRVANSSDQGLGAVKQIGVFSKIPAALVVMWQGQRTTQLTLMFIGAECWLDDTRINLFLITLNTTHEIST